MNTGASRRIDPWFAFPPDEDWPRLLACIREDSERLTRLALAAMERADDVGTVLAPMLLCLCEDQQAFSLAVTSHHGRLAMISARAIFECSVNAMRIAVGGLETARLAQRHAAQKTFRDLDRRQEIAGSVVGVRHPMADAAVPPPLVAAISEFSTKSGKEKRDWLDESIEEKLALIAGSESPARATCFSMAILGIYRHSSEILHGSFCGAIYSLGEDVRLTAGHIAADPRPKRRTERLGIAIQSVTIMYSEAVQVIARILEAPELARESREALLVCFRSLVSRRDTVKTSAKL